MLRKSIHRLALVACLMGLCVLSSALAAEIAGVRFDDQAQVADQTLVLNGAGVRRKFFIKVYVAALYTTQKTSRAAEVISSAAPRRLVLWMLRAVDADTLNSALLDGLHANLTPSALSALQAPLAQLRGLLHGLGKLREGDSVTLDFTSTGIALAVNGKAQGTVSSAAMAAALLQVWLGEQPADAALKQALLGL